MIMMIVLCYQGYYNGITKRKQGLDLWVFIYRSKGRVYNTGKENLQGKNKGGGIIYVGSFFRRETFQQCHEQSQDQKQIPGIFLARGADHRGSYGRGISSGLRPGGIYARGTDALRSDDSHSDCRDPYCFDCHSHRAVFSVARREEKVAVCRSIKRQFLATHSSQGYEWGLAPEKTWLKPSHS